MMRQPVQFPQRVTGGKPLYGAPLGILMLEARFPRIPGDMGNARTWDFPVLYKIVKGASPDVVVLRQAEGMLQAFVDAARELAALGACGITTNCGFLSLFQNELAAACQVPVLASSLMQVPMAVSAALSPAATPPPAVILMRMKVGVVGLPAGMEKMGEVFCMSLFLFDF